jgi:hypothetical protein
VAVIVFSVGGADTREQGIKEMSFFIFMKKVKIIFDNLSQEI